MEDVKEEIKAEDNKVVTRILPLATLCHEILLKSHFNEDEDTVAEPEEDLELLRPLLVIQRPSCDRGVVPTAGGMSLSPLLHTSLYC